MTSLHHAKGQKRRHHWIHARMTPLCLPDMAWHSMAVRWFTLNWGCPQKPPDIAESLDSCAYSWHSATNNHIVEINLCESTHFLSFMTVLEAWFLYNHTKNKSNWNHDRLQEQSGGECGGTPLRMHAVKTITATLNCNMSKAPKNRSSGTAGII